MMAKISINDSLECVHKLAELTVFSLDPNEKKRHDEIASLVADCLNAYPSRKVVLAVVSNIFTNYAAMCLEDEMLGPCMRDLRKERLDGAEKQKGGK